jgi:hypothetical protein
MVESESVTTKRLLELELLPKPERCIASCYPAHQTERIQTKTEQDNALVNLSQRESENQDENRS